MENFAKPCLKHYNMHMTGFILFNWNFPTPTNEVVRGVHIYIEIWLNVHGLEWNYLYKVVNTLHRAQGCNMCFSYIILLFSHKINVNLNLISLAQLKGRVSEAEDRGRSGRTFEYRLILIWGWSLNEDGRQIWEENSSRKKVTENNTAGPDGVGPQIV